MEIGEVFQVIGELGRAQLFIVTILYVIYTYGALHILQLVFVGHIPKFWCVDEDRSGGGDDEDGVWGFLPFVRSLGAKPEDDKLRDMEMVVNGSHHTDLTDMEWNDDVCAKFDVRNCSKLKFLDDHTTIVTEWRLVCEDSVKVSLCISIFMIGVFAGSFLTGYISDHVGRKKSLFICLFIGSLSSTISSFSPSYEFFTVTKFISGFFFCGLQLITFVYLTEVVGASKRAQCGTIFESALAVSTIIFTGSAYLILDWRLLILLTSLTGFLLTPLFLLLPESPRWLLINGRRDDADDVLRWIARWNRRDYSMVRLRSCSDQVAKAAQQNTICTLFKVPRLRNRIIILMYTWFCVLGNYYGLSMNAEDLESDIYINELLLCLVELPGLLIAMVMMTKCGRKITISVSMLICGASCALIFLIPIFSTSHLSHHTSQSLKTGLALFGKMAVTMAMATSFIHTSELMPTTVRNTALGLCVMMGRVGSIGAPFIAKLPQVFHYPLVEYIVFGAMAFTSGGLCLFLSETLNRPMPETVEDALMTPPPMEKRLPSRRIGRNHENDSLDSTEHKSNYGSIN